jgi:hypothetical protein
VASIYKRKHSKFWFIKYRGDDGKWHNKSTGLRYDVISATKMAKLLEKAQTLKELHSRKPIASDRWMPRWIEETGDPEYALH